MFFFNYICYILLIFALFRIFYLIILNNMWFSENDIIKYNYEPILLDDLHGYVLPHAGTKYTGNILAHTLQFQPSKNVKNIVIIFLPSNEKENVTDENNKKYFH